MGVSYPISDGSFQCFICGLTNLEVFSVRNILTFTAASAIALLASSSAYASTVLFNITGPNVISFTAEQSPIPDFVASNYFNLNAHPVTINGNASITGLSFDTTGGLNVENFTSVGITPYYSGGTQTPTFLTGSYSLLGRYTSDLGVSSGTYNLTISQVAAVPEPASWAMLIFGFGAAGVAIRRTRATTLRVHYAA